MLIIEVNYSMIVVDRAGVLLLINNEDKAVVIKFFGNITLHFGFFINNTSFFLNCQKRQLFFRPIVLDMLPRFVFTNLTAAAQISLVFLFEKARKMYKLKTIFY